MRKVKLIVHESYQGGIGIVEGALYAFKSGLYSTITSTFTGLFRR